MTARNKYVVTHSLAAIQTNFTKDRTREVYSDQVTMTPQGDVVFYQVRDSALVNDKGVRNMEKDMAIVLVLKGSMFDSIHLVAPAGDGEAYKEAGTIQLTH